MLGSKKLHLLLLTTVGSRLHRLDLETSDTDLKGVFVWDSSALFGLDSLPETLDAKKVPQEDWKSLVAQLNLEFGLDLEDDDDLSLFEAKKFFLTGLKNDFNVLDMLFSPLEHVFCADVFLPALESRELFLDTSDARQRFLGMAKGCLEEAKRLDRKKDRTPKQERDLAKNLAKSLQFLFSFESFLKTGVHSPAMEGSQRDEVLEVKKGMFPFRSVARRWEELDARVNDLLDSGDFQRRESDRPSLQGVLLSLCRECLC